jgi:hypothetical protein
MFARFVRDSASLIRFMQAQIMSRHLDPSGFTAPDAHAPGGRRRNVAFAELIATVALTLGTAIATIVVTAGIARADVGAAVTGNDAGLFSVALLLGLVFLGLGGLSMWPGQRRQP